MKDTTVRKEQKIFVLDIVPIGKPRMTRRDKWGMSAFYRNKQSKYLRKSVSRYCIFKEELKLLALQQRLVLPSVIKKMYFYLPMPESWGKKKKEEYYHSLHTQKPDLDNLKKAVLDALCKEDSHIALIEEGLGKFWDYKGSIVIEL